MSATASNEDDRSLGTFFVLVAALSQSVLHETGMHVGGAVEALGPSARMRSSASRCVSRTRDPGRCALPRSAHIGAPRYSTPTRCERRPRTTNDQQEAGTRKAARLDPVPS